MVEKFYISTDKIIGAIHETADYGGDSLITTIIYSNVIFLFICFICLIVSVDFIKNNIKNNKTIQLSKDNAFLILAIFIAIWSGYNFLNLSLWYGATGNPYPELARITIESGNLNPTNNISNIPKELYYNYESGLYHYMSAQAGIYIIYWSLISIFGIYISVNNYEKFAESKEGQPWKRYTAGLFVGFSILFFSIPPLLKKEIYAIYDENYDGYFTIITTT